jgi:hypothetical protein
MSPQTQGFAAVSDEEIIAVLQEVSGRHRLPVHTDRLARRFAEKRGVASNEASLAGRLKDLAEKGVIEAERDMAGNRKWRPRTN